MENKNKFSFSQVGQFISLQEAQTYIHCYQDDQQKKGEPQEDTVWSELFGKEMLLQILQHADAVSFCFGKGTDGKMKLVVMGIDPEGRAIIGTSNAGLKDQLGQSLILANGRTCPPYCLPEDVVYVRGE